MDGFFAKWPFGMVGNLFTWAYGCHLSDTVVTGWNMQFTSENARKKYIVQKEDIG